MKQKFTKPFYRIFALALIALLSIPFAAFADTLAVDGDGAIPIGTNELNFGNVCAGTTVTKSVLLAVDANGHPGAGNNVFANSATVTVAVASVAGTGLSANGGGSTTLQSNWTTLPNGTQSSSVSSAVTLVAGGPSSFTGSVNYSATGNKSTGGTLTRNSTLNVIANITNCDTTGPALNLPSNITKEATGSTGAVVTYTFSPTDPSGIKSSNCSPASGSTFALGTTTVNCSATDNFNNTSNGSFTVTVVDTTPPALTLPAPPAAEATSASGAAVSYTATASDLVDGSVGVSCTPASGSTFALGTTTVNCSAADAQGNTAHGGFTVTVQDTTPPALSLSDTSAEATGPDGAAVSYTATASDLVDGSVAVSCTPASESIFELGTTAVACSATDAHSNTAHGSFNVTVVDTTAPVVTVPADFTAEATGPAGAAVTYSASAVDAVDGPITPTCSPASGSPFALDTTTAVACSATDAHANTASKSFNVTVQDTTAPAVTVPVDIIAEATSASGAAVSYTATASDLVDGSVAVSCSPASGSTFALGTTTVNCSATDTHHNTAHRSFNVTVQDITAPELTLPAPVAEATGPNGAVVSYTATASDLVDGSIVVSCSPASGSTFALGATTVNCSATDAHGNTAHGIFTVTVRDTTPPALTLPADMAVDATSASGAVVNYTASADDLVDGAVSVICSPASGSSFPLATPTTVNCSATDAAGNIASGSFTVTVRYGRDGGILQPINPDNSSLFKRGGSVPVKFQLKNDTPNGFNTSAWTLQRVKVDCLSGEGTAGEDVPSTTPSSTFRYDATADQYIYNADFRTATVGTCWKVVVDLKDGSLPLTSAVFKLSK